MPVNAWRMPASRLLFIDADEAQIKAAADVGAPYIEIHTGCYADAKTDAEQARSWNVLPKRPPTPPASA